MQPTAQAVGGKWELSKPQRGARMAMTQTPEGRLSSSRVAFSHRHEIVGEILSADLGQHQLFLHIDPSLPQQLGHRARLQA